MSEGDPDDEPAPDPEEGPPRDDADAHDETPGSHDDAANEDPETDEPAETTAADESAETPEADEPAAPAEADAPAETPETDEPAEAPETDESAEMPEADDGSTEEGQAGEEPVGEGPAEAPASEPEVVGDESLDDDLTVSGETPAGDPGAVGAVESGAPDDQEMPLAAHIEEMVRRLAVVIGVMAIISAITFPFADRLINFLWYSFLPGSPDICGPVAAAAAENITNNTTAVVENGSAMVNGTVNATVNATNATAANVTNATAANVTNATNTTANVTNTSAAATDAACPRIYHPLALVLARLKMASLAGFVVALPVFVYETYLFMRPGLYPNERRYYLSSVPTSLVLAGVGIAFAYFLVLPVIFTYFLGYSQPVAEIAFGLSETFDLILLMLGMFAFIFQIPLFVMLAIMMGVTTRRWLESRRLYFWFGFAGLAFIFSPDPTGMAPFIVALTMVVLFEGTLLLLRWTGR